MTTFKDFLLKKELLKSLKQNSFDHPSEVQEQCIPKAITNKDILCQAKSGTGKTAVFVLSSLQKLNNFTGKMEQNLRNPAPTPKIVVVVNTKELAVQVTNEYKRFLGDFKGVETLSLYGGRKLQEITAEIAEKSKTAKIEICVSTPGKLKELAEGGMLDLSEVHTFIVDECDQLMGRPELRHQVHVSFLKTPAKKQSMFFSATFTEQSKQICEKYLRDPFTVIVDEQKLTLHGLEQLYAEIKSENVFDAKMQALEKILDDNKEIIQCVIFVKNPSSAEKIANRLNMKLFPTVSITSREDTKQRLSKFEAFKNFEQRILVSTNVMSRGIDIADVNFVVNFDMPENAQTYLHRVGRAGRFETKGTAISFVGSPEDVEVLNDIQRRFEVSIKLFSL